MSKSETEVFHEYYNILNEEQVSALFTAVHWKKNKLGEDTSLMSFLHCALFEQCTGKKERSWMRKLFLRLPFLRAHFSRAFVTLLWIMILSLIFLVFSKKGWKASGFNINESYANLCKDLSLSWERKRIKRYVDEDPNAQGIVFSRQHSCTKRGNWVR